MEKRRGKSSILIWLIILVVGAALFVSYQKKKQQEIESGPLGQMKTPEGAAFVYIRGVNSFKQKSAMGTGGAQDVLLAVTKDDEDWFKKNQDSIYEARRAGLNDFIGYNSTTTVEESVFALHELLSGSPNRDDSTIAGKEISGDRARLTIEQGTAYGGSLTFVMDLKKEGALWKVDGFCGQRAQLEREIAGL
jgi:hypothetical protein